MVTKTVMYTLMVLTLKNVLFVTDPHNVFGDSYAQVSTKCDAIMCDAGYRVQNHTCVQQVTGKYNTENQDSSGARRCCRQWITCDFKIVMYILMAIKDRSVYSPGSHNVSGDPLRGSFQISKCGCYYV